MRVVVAGVGLALAATLVVALFSPLDEPAPDVLGVDDGANRVEPAPLAAGRPAVDLPSEPIDIAAADLRDELLRLSDDIQQQFADSPEALHVAALLQLDLKKTKEAEKIWRRCIDLAPRQPGPYAGLARAAMELGKDEVAVDAVQRGYKAGCVSDELDSELASALTKLGRLDEAEQVLQKGLNTSPDNAGNLLQLGQVQSQLGKLEQAEANIKSAISLGATSESAYFTLAAVCMRQRKTEEAAEYRAAFNALKEAAAAAASTQFQDRYDTELRRIAVATICRAGAVFDRQGDAARAEALFRRAIELEPNNEVACGELAMLCRRQERFVEAAALHRRLSEVDPTNVFHFVNLASVASRSGDRESAEAALNKVIELRPDMSLGYAGLAQLYLQDQDAVAARSFAEAALRRTATSTQETANAYLVLAAACEQLGDERAAQQAHTAARQLSPPQSQTQPAEPASPATP